ncbi:MAG: molecular chaperone DnaJ, partial [Euryarchaeota archaeon]|nr:molecular chaperone DnaJ [Euryarchaeota archaeon]
MPPNGRDYYDILGVPRDATPEQVKRAYRELVKKHHPDVARDKKAAEARFKEISEAYEVLADEGKRATYDQHGHTGVDFGRQGFTWQNFSRWQDISDLFSRDLFRDFFGGDIMGAFRQAQDRSPWEAGPEAGDDLRADITVTLEEVHRGARRELVIPVREACGECHGRGLEPGTEPTRCRDCGGTGQVRRESRTPLGYFATVTPCNRCGGRGSVASRPCRRCDGRGSRPASQRVEIQVPPGVDDGVRLRLQGRGEPGLRGGPAGDLYVVVHTAPHNLFQRHGIHLGCELPLTFTQAALGGEVPVPTLDGDARLRVPPGIQTGEVLTVKGKGLPQLNGGRRGDLHVKVRVVTPIKLGRRQRELLEELQRDEGGDAGKRGMFR